MPRVRGMDFEGVVPRRYNLVPSNRQQHTFRLNTARDPSLTLHAHAITGMMNMHTSITQRVATGPKNNAASDMHQQVSAASAANSKEHRYVGAGVPSPLHKDAKHARSDMRT